MQSDRSAPRGYHNYVNDQRDPRDSFKKAIIAIGAIIVIGVLTYFGAGIIRSINTENNEQEEPYAEWAGDNSPLVGIQILTQNGLTYEEYADFYEKATTYYKNNHQDYEYVEYIEGSLAMKNDTVEDAPAKNCIPEDVESYEASEMGFWSCHEDTTEAWVTTIKLRASNGDEYYVEIEPDGSAAKVNVRIYNPLGDKVL